VVGEEYARQIQERIVEIRRRARYVARGLRNGE
jgi:tRNA A-37 threonylcarbamoyl transferase component Bud32